MPGPISESTEITNSSPISFIERIKKHDSNLTTLSKLWSVHNSIWQGKEKGEICGSNQVRMTPEQWKKGD